MSDRERMIDEAVWRVRAWNDGRLYLCFCKGRLLPVADALAIRDEFMARTDNA